MRIGLVLRSGIVLLAAVVATAATASRAEAQDATLQGAWRNGDTSIRITVNKLEAKGMFVEVGQEARALGFKPGETSLAATVVSTFYLHGEQTIRYSGTFSRCYPNGRKVPIMGRMTPDGRGLAVHFYNVTLDPNCRDTGAYDITQTIWERVPGR